MSRLLLKATVFAALMFAYIASPFVTAWSIREAVRNGDSAYLARAIEWDSVRTTLKPTLSKLAFNMPEPGDTSAPQPGLWQRFKAYWGQGAVDTAIDNYLTPEGLPQLFQARKAWRTYVTGFDEDANKPPLLERIKRTWARVKRAEFTTLAEFEVDMLDKWDDSRMYLGKLSLTPFGWKLTELRVKTVTTANNEPQKLFTEPKTLGQRLGGLRFISRAEAAPARALAAQPRDVTFEGNYGDGLKRRIQVPAHLADEYMAEMQAAGKASGLTRTGG